MDNKGLSKAVEVFSQSLSIIFVCLILATSIPSVSHAIERGMTLSPLRNDINILPGTTYTGRLSVTNNTGTKLAVSLSAEEFSVINQQYDYAFNTETELINWVTFASNTIEVAPGETKIAEFRVGVPISAEPGGRYISLFASTDSEQKTGAITSRQRIASLLYITVEGDVTRYGALMSLSSPWLISGDTKWSAVLRNSGSAHFRSRYSVELQNVIGNGIVNQSVGEALILPGTVRRLTETMPRPIYPGIYKINYTIGLGDQSPYNSTRIIVYMPTWLTIGIIVTGLIVTTYGLVRRHSKA